MLIVLTLPLFQGGCTSGGSRGGIALNPAPSGSGQQSSTGGQPTQPDSRTTGDVLGGTPPGGDGVLDDPEPEPIDPFELEEWNVVSFTDPRDQSVYDIIDGRVLVSFKNAPQLPDVDPNYFDVERYPNDPVYSTGYPLIVGDPQIDAFIAAENLTVYSEWRATKCMGAVLPEGQTVADAVANWPSEYPDLIQCVDPDAVGGTCAWPQDDPNDDCFPGESGQWALNDDYLYSIRIQDVWKQSDGLGISSVAVAVLDTGVDYQVLDLQANSTPQGCDCGDKVSSTTFGPRTAGHGSPANVWKNLSDDNAKRIGHGTCVAGIISARINNDPPPIDLNDGDNTAGIAYNPRYFPVAMKSKPGISTSTTINGLYAVACVKRIFVPGSVYGWGHPDPPFYNIEVLNCSFQTIDSYAMRMVVNPVSKYILMVGAAGNNGSWVSSVFPASHPRVMSVAAYDGQGLRSVWSQRESSNFAPDTDICAPGSNIVTSDMYDTAGSRVYGWERWMVNHDFNGTSAAAPHVAGVAALVQSKHPSWTPGQVWEQILETKVFDLPPSGISRFGRISAAGAMQ